MKKIVILTLSFFSTLSLFAQYITLSPAYSEVEGDPSVITPVVVELHNTGTDQTMTWLRTKNEIPELWSSSVCDFTLCWAPGADSPGNYFEAPSDTNGIVHVQFDARNFYDGAIHPAPGCGEVEVMFYSVEDSLNYHALGVFHAKLGVEECQLTLISPNSDNNFLVYPNPAVNILNTVASFSANVNKVEIINIVGRSIKEFKWNTASGKMTFDITDVPQGIYFVRLLNTENQAVFTEKISVTK